MPTELSPHNARIEQVHDLLGARGRRAAGRFAVEGVTLLDEAARSGLVPREVYATAAGLARFDAGRYEADGVPVYLVPVRSFARLSDVESPTGVLGVFDLPERVVAGILALPGPILLLAGVNDPGNAGTLVRSAEAFGAAGVLFGRGGVDPYAPKVVRAAMGSLFRVPVAQVEAAEMLQAAAAAGRPVVAVDLDGDELDGVAIPPGAILAVGNERHGVREWLPRWDQAVRIPQCKATESLNAAVAGSIVLYHCSRVK